MPASPSAPLRIALLRLSCLALCVASCGKRESATARPEPPKRAPAAGPAQDTARTETPAAQDSEPAEIAPAAPARLAFASHPPKAYLGKSFSYQPTLDIPGACTFRLAKPADSSMKLEKGRLLWTPAHTGRFPVILEAETAAGSGEGGKLKAQQSFTLEVAPVLSLALKPLPAQAGKGDTVVFDLRGSSWPAWAAPSLTVRFDWDGDGTWDTEALPLPAHAAERHAYTEPGRYLPRIEARYASYETKEAKGAISIVSAVTAVLKIAPDTVEPGGEYRVDASGSRSDGRLVFFLDVDGDGKPEWSDSASGKAALKAPASGVYNVKLIARDPMGQEGKAEASLRVNARPKIEFRVRNAKENMAAAVDFKIRAKDADDSIRSVRFNYTGDAKDWDTRAAPDSQSSGHEWFIRLKHPFGKEGQYAPSACAASADGREVCQQLKVEIFNAPPVCKPGEDLHATVGKPVAIDGSGVDPDGSIVKWEWDLDGDGKYDLVSKENGKFQYTFSKEGIFKLTLRVTTADGMTATGVRKVEVRKKWKT